MIDLMLIEKIKKNPEPFIFMVLATMLALSFLFAPVAYLTLFAVIGFSFIVKSETIIYMYVFLYPFGYLLLFIQLQPIYFFMILLMSVALFKNYIMDLVKKRRTLNFKQSPNSLRLLITFIVINIYILLPFHDSISAWYLLVLTHMFPSFFSYIYRKTLDIKKIIYIFSISMIVSGVLYLFREYSELLRGSEWVYNSFVRMKGCLDHPNIYAFNVLIALGSLAILYLKNSINPSHFIILFMGNFIFGYLTLSRIFILSVFILLAIFFLLLLSKERLYSFNTILPMVAMLALIVLIFDEATTNYVVRAGDMYEAGYQEKIESLTPEDWELIFAGEKLYDPGRFGIWKIYITYLMQNPFMIIFGKGITNTMLGKKHAHNLFLNGIYWLGIVGVILYLIYAYFMLGGKKIFKLKKTKYMILLFIPLFVFQLAEKISDISIFYWLIMFNLQEDKFNTNEDYAKMNYMLEKNKPYKFKLKIF